MDFVKELFFTGFLAVFMSFLVAKIVLFLLSNDESQKSVATEVTDSPAIQKVKEEQGNWPLCNRMEVSAISIEEEVQISEAVKVSVLEMTHAAETEEARCSEVPASLVNSVPLVEENDSGKEEEEGILIEEDWEGIERSETEQLFAKAARLVESGERATLLDGESLQLELYALSKVAIEGPCSEQPPFSLKFSARAKWNAWHKLGNMSPEVAMEQYVSIVSSRVSGWINDRATPNSKSSTSEVNSCALSMVHTNDSQDDSCSTFKRHVEIESTPDKTDCTENHVQQTKIKN